MTAFKMAKTEPASRPQPKQAKTVLLATETGSESTIHEWKVADRNAQSAANGLLHDGCGCGCSCGCGCGCG